MDSQFKFRVNQITLLPDHAIVQGAFETAPNMPSYSFQIGMTAEEAKKFTPGKVYSVSFAEEKTV